MCVSGFPAQEHEKELKFAAGLRQVPRLLERVKELEKKISELEHPTDNDR
jgi:UDP-3-O-[3-hydroxymyristoyl] glucosamine N-acyltransferase